MKVSLSPKKVKIVAEVAKGAKYKDIAKKYDVSMSTISRAVKFTGNDIKKMRKRKYKIPTEKFVDIVTDATSGVDHKDIAKKYKVSRQHITRILNRLGWFEKGVTEYF